MANPLAAIAKKLSEAVRGAVTKAGKGLVSPFSNEIVSISEGRLGNLAPNAPAVGGPARAVAQNQGQGQAITPKLPPRPA